MARLSIKEQRAKEIVGAFERCIARNGINGAQLEDIAEESGIQRPALRHFVGNRDALILALTKSLVNEYKQTLTQAGKLLDKIGKTSDDLLLLLFMQSKLTTAERVLVIVNLYSIAARYPKVNAELNVWYKYYVQWVFDHLARFKPNASKENLSTVAGALVSLSFNMASLAPVGISDRDFEDMMDAATKLVDTL